MAATEKPLESMGYRYGRCGETIRVDKIRYRLSQWDIAGQDEREADGRF